MYTQCPDCRESFHVTAEILQQASGRVRCGNCGHVFDALDGLSEAPPASDDAADADDERSFRDVLDELGDTGNVSLEDTGVEWRLVEEPLELETPTAEERYDDHTPIPGLLDDDIDDAPDIIETPRRRAEDLIEPRSPELDERQVDLALGAPEEWTDLLQEVDDTDDAEPVREASTAPSADRGAAPEEQGADALVADDDPTAEHPVFDAGELTLVEDDAPSDDALPDAEEWTLLPEPQAGAAAAPLVPAPTEAEMTIDRLIDQDLLRLTGEQDALNATHPGARPAVPQHVETIVMEGEFVRSSLHGEVAGPNPADDAPLEDARSFRDTYIRSRDVTRPGETVRSPARYSGIAAAALLVLLLAGQLVHANRETLATWQMFDDTVGSVYRRLGAPITPDWDVNGWQFQTSTGSTDASNSALTISARITNRSEHALPYPLLHVTLTDRYEEVVGSDLLEPEQYLAIRSAQGMVAPGKKFTATVIIAPLSASADGFKLNVCYPIPGGNVRCATGAFKH